MKNILSLLQKHYHTLSKKFIKFFIVGSLCAIVDFLVLITFKELLLFHYLLANIIAGIFSLSLEFTLFKKYVFRSKKKPLREVIKYLNIQFLTLVIDNIALLIFVEKLGIYYLLAKIMTMAITMWFNFIGSLKFTFK